MKHCVRGAVLILTWVVLVMPALGQESTPQKAKPIDVVLCLDTSNSMDGLIESAKRKLWDIVNDLAKAKPVPQLRVALYSYGNDGYDPKTGWVRKDVDLTTDLDKISEKLFSLRTHGGTEYCARVAKAALDQLDWSADAGALKLMFVCGNEPADQDKEIPLKTAADYALRKGVIINTIYCGSASSPEVAMWRNFAVMAEGRFASIDQEGGRVAIATPVDAELTKLGTELNRTYVFFGKEAKARAENQVAQDANAASAGLQIAASRATSKASSVYQLAEVDLVDRMKTDPKFDVKKVAKEELSEELQKLTPEQRETFVKEKLAKREELQKRIGQLSRERDDHIQKELKKLGGKADQAFDQAVRAVLREQAKKKGLDIPE